jgi:hypothetical protein
MTVVVIARCDWLCGLNDSRVEQIAEEVGFGRVDRGAGPGLRNSHELNDVTFGISECLETTRHGLEYVRRQSHSLDVGSVVTDVHATGTFSGLNQFAQK